MTAEIRDLTFGIYDRLADHRHCLADVVLAPAGEDGEPDWTKTDPANVEKLPADEWPQDEQTARRACVIVSDIAGCDPDASFIVRLNDGTPELIHIHGPESDRPVAEQIIARDIGADPIVRPKSTLFESMDKLAEKLRLGAANDNAPAKQPSTKLTDEQELELLGKFQHEQLLPGERGELVFDEAFWRAMGGGPFWHISGAIIEGHSGDVFVGPLDGQPKFQLVDGRQGPITPRAPMPVENPADWAGRKLPRREWYIDGYVPANTVTLISGDGAAGKSLTLAQILAASAMGISTLDLSPTKGRALLLAAEDDQNELHRRFDAIARAHGRTLADLGDLRVASLADVDAVLGGPDKRGNVIPTALWHRTLKIIESFRPAVVGLDTLADLSAVDEIKRNQARAFIAMIRKAAIKYNFTGILLAHPSLSGLREGTGTSGSTGWNNSVRSRLYLTVEKGSDVRTLQHVKSNYGGLQPDIQIVYNDGIFVRHDPSKPAIADGLINGRNDNLFMAVLSKLNRTGQRPSPNKSPSYAPRMIQKHPDAKGTKVRDMEMAMQRLLDSGAIKIVQEGPPSRRFSRLIVSSEDFGGADDG